MFDINYVLVYIVLSLSLSLYLFQRRQNSITRPKVFIFKIFALHYSCAILEISWTQYFVHNKRIFLQFSSCVPTANERDKPPAPTVVVTATGTFTAIAIRTIPVKQIHVVLKSPKSTLLNNLRLYPF